MKQTDWLIADDEIPVKDEVLCLLCIEIKNEFERLKYYDIGYIFEDKWYDEKEHEIIEINGKVVLYWIELPALP